MVPVHGRRVKGVCRVNKRRDHMKIKFVVWEQVVYLKSVLFVGEATQEGCPVCRNFSVLLIVRETFCGIHVVVRLLIKKDYSQGKFTETCS
jgi:hypothetical protein